MVSGDKYILMLVNFDWAGEDGQVFYPTPNVNDQLLMADNLKFTKADDIQVKGLSQSVRRVVFLYPFNFTLSTGRVGSRRKRKAGKPSGMFVVFTIVQRSFLLVISVVDASLHTAMDKYVILAIACSRAFLDKHRDRYR